MKKILCMLLALMLLFSLCSCGSSNDQQGGTDAPAAADSPAEAESPAEANAPAADSPVGYYSLTELTADGETESAADLEAMGLTYYLVFEADGTGYFDALGEKDAFTWNDKEITSDLNGSSPYKYADGVLKIEDKESSMTFVRLSEEKLAHYMENGSGSVDDLFGGLGGLLSEEEGERFENEGALENCYVKFIGAEALEDEDGKAAVRVWYEFKNTGSEICTPNDSLFLSAKQGENELDWTYLFNDIPECDYYTLAVAPGLTLRCAQLFSYSPEGGEIEFSIGGWYGDKVCYVVDPSNLPGAPADSFILAAENASYASSDLAAADGSVEILGSEIVKDYNDNDVVLFHIRWTNTGDEEDSFSYNYSCYALQDGYGLTVTSSDSYADEQSNTWAEVQPGESVDLALVFNLRSSSDVFFFAKQDFGGDSRVGGLYALS